MTPLDKSLRRSLKIKGVDYVVTITPEALKLTRKGRRIGVELKWADITSGESALAVALQASVGKFDPADEKRPEAAEKRPAQAKPSATIRKGNSSRRNSKPVR